MVTDATRRIKDMAVGERPQERLERHGPEALSDRELLAILLRSGQRGLDIVSLSGSLIDEAGSLSGLMRWSREDFKRVHGIGDVKAAQLETVMEIARRILREWESDGSPVSFSDAEPVARHLRTLAAGLTVEKFWVLCLDRKNRLLRMIEATSGTATSSLVHPREVFREAIKLSATAVIVAHNHPSGDPAPSRADIQVTRQLREAAKIVGIDLLDHVIIGDRAKDPQGSGYYSFNDAGLV